MNILHISPEWKWSKIFIAPIAYKQIDEGHLVWLSTPNPIENDINLDKLNIVSWNAKYKNIILYFISIFTIVSMVKKNKIKKVYCHTSIDSYIYILALSLFSRVDLIYVNHGVPYIGYKGFLLYFLKFIDFVNISLSKRTITITPSMLPFLKRINFFNRDIRVMNPGTISGIDIKYNCYKFLKSCRAIKKNNFLKIIYVGRIEHRKGLYDLIESISASDIKCELIVLGGNKEEFKAQFDENRIKFLGFQSELEKYYLSADILCVPSHHEGFGQIYLEAASYGVIPICCDIPGPTDFIKHNVNGFIVKKNDPKSISLLMYQIINNIYDLEKLSEQAYISAKKYERSLVLTQNMELFR